VGPQRVPPLGDSFLSMRTLKTMRFIPRSRSAFSISPSISIAAFFRSLEMASASARRACSVFLTLSSRAFFSSS
jgi:hypothetical protein